MPIARHALWAEVGGGILWVTLGEFSGVHKNAPDFLQGGGSDPFLYGAMNMLVFSGTAQSPW